MMRQTETTANLSPTFRPMRSASAPRLAKDLAGTSPAPIVLPVCSAAPSAIAKAATKGMMQGTVARTVNCRGVSLHGGVSTTLTIMPAEAGSGIRFRRSDLPTQPFTVADWRVVSPTPLCTTLVMPDANKIATIEHLMAAFWAAGIDNAEVLVDGPELPILDGSSAPYLQLLDDAGRASQKTVRRILKVLQPVRVQDGDRWVELLPFDGFAIDLEIVFANPVIGRQHYYFDGSVGQFTDALSAARTFGFLSDVEALQQQGLVRGASTDNSVVVGPDSILNPNGLRFDDEFVRHKVLDCVGDLMMAGARMQAQVRAYKSGHAMNYLAVRQLFNTPGAWAWVDAAAS